VLKFLQRDEHPSILVYSKWQILPEFPLMGLLLISQGDARLVLNEDLRGGEQLGNQERSDYIITPWIGMAAGQREAKGVLF